MPWSEPKSSESLFGPDGEHRCATPLFSVAPQTAHPLDPNGERAVQTPSASNPTSAEPAPNRPLTDDELRAQVEAFRAAEAQGTDSEPIRDEEPETVPRDQFDALQAERDDLLREREVLSKQLADREAHLSTSIGALDAAARALRDSATETVVRLATLIARRVMDRELEMDSELVADMSQSALDQIDGFAVAEVRVHPTDFPGVRSRLERNVDGKDRPVVRVVADGDIARGGCVVSTDGAEVDGRMETRFERLEESLLEAMTAAVARPAITDDTGVERDAVDALHATMR